MANGRSLFLSGDFVPCSGTVPVDVEKGLVLLLYYRRKKEILLPKGRKDIGENLQSAAVRETFEESGYSCQLVPHTLPTKASDTRPGSTSNDYNSSNGHPHTEPIAVQQRVSNGVHKIIFWYLAKADSSVKWTLDTQDDNEDFEPRWIPIDKAVDSMSYPDDRCVVSQALRAVADLEKGKSD